MKRRWLVSAALLPWVLLAGVGGTFHNHSPYAVSPALAGAALPADPDACGSPRLSEAPAAVSDRPCIACLWQIQSGATSHISPDTPSEPVVAFRAAACESRLLGTDVLSFDPRAPPLS